MNKLKRNKNINRLICVGVFVIMSQPMYSFGEKQSPLWDKNWKNNISRYQRHDDDSRDDNKSMFDTSYKINNIGEQCGPAPNELCISCHELSTNAPDPQIRIITEPTHGVGMYKLSAKEYLSINMHTFSQSLQPKCTSCHFNPKISKEELKSFQYAKMGDRICYTCHQDKAPDKFRDNNDNNIAQGVPKENGIMEELKQQFFAKRASVAAYRKRLKID